MGTDLEVKKVNQIVIKYMKKFKIPGVSVTVYQNGKSEIMSYGYSDVFKREKVKEDSCFELGSVSKSFTAAAIYLCEEKGLLSIDDYVTKYIPWLVIMDEQNKNNIASSMKISNFIFHTSGFHSGTLQLLKEGSSDEALKKTVTELNGINTFFNPGEQFNYATINYDVLGYILECVSGKSYEEFLQNELLNPLGLHNTYLTRKDAPVMTKGYKMGVLFPRVYSAPVFRGNVPAGHIISNAIDMGKWMEIQLNYSDLPAPFDTVIEKCHRSNCTVAPFYRYYYAGGWFVSMTKNKMYHAGDTANYSSMVVINRKKKLGVCVLTNIDLPVTEYLGNSILKILEGIEVKEYQLGSYEKMHFWFKVISFLSVFLWPFLIWEKAFVSIPVILFFLLYICTLGIVLKKYIAYSVKLGMDKVNIKTIRLWSPYSYMTGFFIGVGTFFAIVCRCLAVLIQ